MMQFNVIGVILAVGAIAMSSGLPVSLAATSPTLETPQLNDEAPSIDIKFGLVRPLSVGEDSQSPPRGNPLWLVPLSVLTATKERPIFSASRRPPARAVMAPPVEQVSAPAPSQSNDLVRPALALIGTVVGDGDAIAVFLDRSTLSILRLRRGDINAGWSVDSILKGEVILARANQTEAFVLPLPDTSQGSSPSDSSPIAIDRSTSCVMWLLGARSLVRQIGPMPPRSSDFGLKHTRT